MCYITSKTNGYSENINERIEFVFQVLFQVKRSVCARFCICALFLALKSLYMRDPRAADLINDRRHDCGLACMKSGVEIRLTADEYNGKHVRVLP